MNATRRSLSLSKGRHRFVFWYYAGQESQVISALVRMARDAGGQFDWLDAALLTHEVAKQQRPCGLDAVS